VAGNVAELMSEAAALKSAAFARSTIRTYKSQTNCFLRFCVNYGLQPAPATQQTLCSYLAFLSRTLSPISVKGYMNAVRLFHIEAGFANPLENNGEVNMIQRGMTRLMGSPPKQKLPITVAILLDLQKSLSDSPSDVAFWAACVLAFFGFLRKSTLLPSAGELTTNKFIARSDVTDMSLRSFILLIRFSKTIQFGQRVLSLPYVACDDMRICPVRALLKHFGLSKLPLARPLFNFVVGGTEVSFTNAFFMKRLRDLLRLTGHPASSISCHSFRRGGASLAYLVGMSAVDIKQRGDWKSNAFERYLTISPTTSLHSARLLAAGASSYR
jgi:hypothetical protein